VSRVTVLVVAACASLALVGTYVAAGGGSYKPAKVADPCKSRDWRAPQGFQELLDQVALSAADGAACELGVPREELVIALGTPGARRRFIREHNLTDAQVEDAARAGVDRAIADARRAGAIGGIEEFLLRQAVKGLPIDFILKRVQGLEAGGG
jgi:hypothetical protein